MVAALACYIYMLSRQYVHVHSAVLRASPASIEEWWSRQRSRHRHTHKHIYMHAHRGRAWRNRNRSAIPTHPHPHLHPHHPASCCCPCPCSCWYQCRMCFSNCCAIFRCWCWCWSWVSGLRAASNVSEVWTFPGYLYWFSPVPCCSLSLFCHLFSVSCHRLPNVSCSLRFVWLSCRPFWILVLILLLALCCSCLFVFFVFSPSCCYCCAIVHILMTVIHTDATMSQRYTIDQDDKPDGIIYSDRTDVTLKHRTEDNRTHNRRTKNTETTQRQRTQENNKHNKVNMKTIRNKEQRELCGALLCSVFALSVCCLVSFCCLLFISLLKQCLTCYHKSNGCNYKIQ